ncbi:flagellar basal body protein [Sphingomonas sp. TREG-RG-20F-R18-01]|uniref:flagellar basal body protein n=1 Tax=Sphingomonas sp. TREG-RG-20F-R18-01 TaxID=2914982 RepID=UPI001F5848BA|nr:flagellar basal body protein [Sphingomonas sp. TREG-RG-20F-R18-01]
MTDLIAGAARQMHYLADRQRVVAQNIANSETPGFKAQDVAAPDFTDLVSAAGGARIASPRVAPTAAMIALGARPGAGAGIVADPDTFETKADGNNVTLEDQLLKMGQIQADFAAVTNIYRKQQALLQTALGKRGG